MRPFFEEYVASFGLQSRVRFHSGDFFKDSLRSADVLVTGMILHDWNLERSGHMETLYLPRAPVLDPARESPEILVAEDSTGPSPRSGE